MEYLLFLKAVLNIILYSRLLYILVISKLRQLNMRRHAHNLETPDCGERPTIWLILITWWHEFSVFSTVSSKIWPVFLFFYGIFFCVKPAIWRILITAKGLIQQRFPVAGPKNHPADLLPNLHAIKCPKSWTKFARNCQNFYENYLHMHIRLHNFPPVHIHVKEVYKKREYFKIGFLD